MRTWPTPPQVLHLVGWLPLRAPLPSQVSHGTSVGTRILTVVPCTTSSRDRVRL